MTKTKSLEEMQFILKEIIDNNEKIKNKLENYKNIYKISVYMENKESFLPENFQNIFISFIERNSKEPIIDFEYKGITQIPKAYWENILQVEESDIPIGICYEFILNASFKEIEILKGLFETNRGSIKFTNIEIKE